MGTYRKIHKTGKMHINSHQNELTSLRVVSVLFSYCFWLYKRASFDVMVSHLLKEDREKLGCPPLPEEKPPKITFIPLSSLPIFAWA